jgi:hypothetical protein
VEDEEEEHEEGEEWNQEKPRPGTGEPRARIGGMTK